MEYILSEAKFKLSINGKYLLALRNYNCSSVLLIINTNLSKIILKKR